MLKYILLNSWLEERVQEEQIYYNSVVEFNQTEGKHQMDDFITLLKEDNETLGWLHEIVCGSKKIQELTDGKLCLVLVQLQREINALNYLGDTDTANEAESLTRAIHRVL